MDFSKIINRSKDLAVSYKQTFNSDHGQKVLADLLKYSKYFEDGANLTNVNQTYYNLGMKKVILQILKYLNLSEADLANLIKQNKVNYNE